MKFRKKPVVIQAERVPVTKHGDKRDLNAWGELAIWLGEEKSWMIVDTPTGLGIEIKTLEGKMLAMPGDWIIRGIQGELYPCKPDIFEATYEPASESKPDTEGGR